MALAAVLWVPITLAVLAGLLVSSPISAAAQSAGPEAPPAPKPAKRPEPSARKQPAAPEAARAARLSRINAVKSWGYQLASLSIETAAASPYGLLVVDATTGLDTGKPFTREQVERLKRAPDGSRRLVVSYLSIGEAEDYRPDYFSPEYLEEEAPDWLMKENPQWKGNRLIRFCHEGWQKTILGDENGRNVYSATEPSPLYRLIELGFDGVYLDRVDVYAEIEKECPNGARRMVDFVARLGEHARKAEPNFMVILQNAEALLDDPKMIETIDAVAKESLFYGENFGQSRNPAETTGYSLKQLRRAKDAGRAVFVVDYVTDRQRNADAVRRIRDAGFVPYIGPRDLAKLWLPGAQF